MIRNLNETLSLISLLIVAFFSFKFFIGGLIPNSEETDNYSKTNLLKNYLDNEED